MGIRHCGAVRCALEAAEQRTPNGEGTEKMSERNRRLRAAGIAALAWAGLAAVWCVLVPGGAAELPQGVPGTLRSLLVLPLAEELVFRGALLRLLRPLGVRVTRLAYGIPVGSQLEYADEVLRAGHGAHFRVGRRADRQSCTRGGAAYPEQWAGAGPGAGRKGNGMTDYELMGAALEEAARAAALGEVPVGAVVARNGEIIAAAHNTRETEKNALHHAELLAIDAACKKLGGWRLWQCELFVTLEPCPMCSGGIINSRIRRVVYGAADTKAGCCGSVTDLFALPFNHHPVVEGGLRAEEAQALLQAFFLRLREQRAAKPRWKPPVTP